MPTFSTRKLHALMWIQQDFKLQASRPCHNGGAAVLGPASGAYTISLSTRLRGNSIRAHLKQTNTPREVVQIIQTSRLVKASRLDGAI